MVVEQLGTYFNTGLLRTEPADHDTAGLNHRTWSRNSVDWGINDEGGSVVGDGKWSFTKVNHTDNSHAASPREQRSSSTG